MRVALTYSRRQIRPPPLREWGQRKPDMLETTYVCITNVSVINNRSQTINRISLANSGLLSTISYILKSRLILLKIFQWSTQHTAFVRTAIVSTSSHVSTTVQP